MPWHPEYFNMHKDKDFKIRISFLISAQILPSNQLNHPEITFSLFHGWKSRIDKLISWIESDVKQMLTRNYFHNSVSDIFMRSEQFQFISIWSIALPN